MKNALLLIFLFVISFQLYAKEGTDTTVKKTDTANHVQPPAKPEPIVTTDTVTSAPYAAEADRILKDTAALDSARKSPSVFLYKNYLFTKKPIANISWFFAALAFLILLLIWIWSISYSVSDGLCKDPSYDENGNLRDPKISPYSYSRVQLLWWTLIILTCYVFFFGITGVLLPLNTTAVLLLGFGAIVCGTSKIIDNRQITRSKGSRNQDVAGNDPVNEPNFIRDILSDDNGISVHRLQAVIFNLVFGVGFLGFFIQSLILRRYPFPDFTDWEFALMGISSATYLGLKASENKPGNNGGGGGAGGAPGNAGGAGGGTANTAQETGEVAAPKAINKF